VFKRKPKRIVHGDMCSCDECLGLSDIRSEMKLMRELASPNLRKMRRTHSREEIFDRLQRPMDYDGIVHRVHPSQVANECIKKLGL
jgi:hypothetical protein